MRTPRPAPVLLVLSIAFIGCSSNNNTSSAPATTSSAAAAPAAVRVTPPAPPGTATGAPVATSPRPATASPAATASGDLTVFAASSLTDAINEIGGNFQKANPGAKVAFNYGASSTLRTQLEQGARADVFASADQANMDQAKKSGVIDGADQRFAKNKLVVIYPTSNPGKISGIQDLAKPGLKFVLTDPSVPIGAYARQALDKLSADPSIGSDFAPKVLANLRSQEANVRAVVSKVQLGEADAAIVYASDVTPSVAKDVQSILIPDQFNVLATYPIAVVKRAQNKAAAQAFIAYVRSAAAQDVLKQNNFIVDEDTGAAIIRSQAPALLASQQVSGR